MVKLATTKKAHIDEKTSAVKNKLHQLKQSMQKKQAEASTAIKSVKEVLTHSVAIFEKPKDDLMPKCIFELKDILQKYNVAKDRVKLAEGNLEPYKASKKLDIATMERELPNLKEKYAEYLLIVANKKLPKAVQEQVNEFDRIYKNDFKNLDNDIKRFNLKPVMEENVIAGTIKLQASNTKM